MADSGFDPRQVAAQKASKALELKLAEVEARLAEAEDKLEEARSQLTKQKPKKGKKITVESDE